MQITDTDFATNVSGQQFDPDRIIIVKSEVSTIPSVVNFCLWFYIRGASTTVLCL